MSGLPVGYTIQGLEPKPISSPEIDKLARRYLGAIHRHASQNGIDPALLKGLIYAESSFNPLAKSDAGAMGLGQLMPDTAKELGVSDPYNAEQNIGGAAKYYAQLRKRYHGDDRLALAAYNAGPGAVDKYGDVPPYAETQAYVNKILPSSGSQFYPIENANPQSAPGAPPAEPWIAKLLGAEPAGGAELPPGYTPQAAPVSAAAAVSGLPPGYVIQGDTTTAPTASGPPPGYTVQGEAKPAATVKPVPKPAAAPNAFGAQSMADVARAVEAYRELKAQHAATHALLTETAPATPPPAALHAAAAALGAPAVPLGPSTIGSPIDQTAVETALVHKLGRAPTADEFHAAMTAEATARGLHVGPTPEDAAAIAALQAKHPGTPVTQAEINTAREERVRQLYAGTHAGVHNVDLTIQKLGALMEGAPEMWDAATTGELPQYFSELSKSWGDLVKNGDIEGMMNLSDKYGTDATHILTQIANGNIAPYIPNQQVRLGLQIGAQALLDHPTARGIHTFLVELANPVNWIGEGVGAVARGGVRAMGEASGRAVQRVAAEAASRAPMGERFAVSQHVGGPEMSSLHARMAASSGQVGADASNEAEAVFERMTPEEQVAFVKRHEKPAAPPPAAEPPPQGGKGPTAGSEPPRGYTVSDAGERPVPGAGNDIKAAALERRMRALREKPGGMNAVAKKQYAGLQAELAKIRPDAPAPAPRTGPAPGAGTMFEQPAARSMPEPVRLTPEEGAAAHERLNQRADELRSKMVEPVPASELPKPPEKNVTPPRTAEPAAAPATSTKAGKVPVEKKMAAARADFLDQVRNHFDDPNDETWIELQRAAGRLRAYAKVSGADVAGTKATAFVKPKSYEAARTALMNASERFAQEPSVAAQTDLARASGSMRAYAKIYQGKPLPLPKSEMFDDEAARAAARDRLQAHIEGTPAADHGAKPVHTFTTKDGRDISVVRHELGEGPAFEAMHEGKPIGQLRLTVEGGSKPGYHTVNVSVARPWQRQGVATGLMDAAEREFPKIQHGDFSPEGKAWHDARMGGDKALVGKMLPGDHRDATEYARDAVTRVYPKQFARASSEHALNLKQTAQVNFDAAGMDAKNRVRITPELVYKNVSDTGGGGARLSAPDAQGRAWFLAGEYSDVPKGVLNITPEQRAMMKTVAGKERGRLGGDVGQLVDNYNQAHNSDLSTGEFIDLIGKQKTTAEYRAMGKDLAQREIAQAIKAGNLQDWVDSHTPGKKITPREPVVPQEAAPAEATIARGTEDYGGIPPEQASEIADKRSAEQERMEYEKAHEAVAAPTADPQAHATARVQAAGHDVKSSLATADKLLTPTEMDSLKAMLDPALSPEAAVEHGQALDLARQDPEKEHAINDMFNAIDDFNRAHADFNEAHPNLSNEERLKKIRGQRGAASLGPLQSLLDQLGHKPLTEAQRHEFLSRATIARENRLIAADPKYARRLFRGVQKGTWVSHRDLWLRPGEDRFAPRTGEGGRTAPFGPGHRVVPTIQAGEDVGLVRDPNWLAALAQRVHAKSVDAYTAFIGHLNEMRNIQHLDAEKPMLVPLHYKFGMNWDPAAQTYRIAPFEDALASGGTGHDFGEGTSGYKRAMSYARREGYKKAVAIARNKLPPTATAAEIAQEAHRMMQAQADSIFQQIHSVVKTALGKGGGDYNPYFWQQLGLDQFRGHALHEDAMSAIEDAHPEISQEFRQRMQNDVHAWYDRRSAAVRAMEHEDGNVANMPDWQRKHFYADMAQKIWDGLNQVQRFTLVTNPGVHGGINIPTMALRNGLPVWDLAKALNKWWDPSHHPFGQEMSDLARKWARGDSQRQMPFRSTLESEMRYRTLPYKSLRFGEKGAAFVNRLGIQNARFVFGTLEHRVLTALFARQVGRGMSYAEAGNFARRALVDYQNLTKIDRNMSNAVIFYPWLKGMFAQWASAGWDAARMWNPGQQAVDRYNEGQEQPNPGKPFAYFKYIDPVTGQPVYGKPNVPQRFVEPIAQAELSILEMFTGRPNPLKGSGTALPSEGLAGVAKPLANELESHLRAPLHGIADVLYTSMHPGHPGGYDYDVSYDPYAAGGQLGDVAGNFARNELMPLRQLEQGANDPTAALQSLLGIYDYQKPSARLREYEKILSEGGPGTGLPRGGLDFMLEEALRGGDPQQIKAIRDKEQFIIDQANAIGGHLR